jgi:hypothetical protein
MAQSKYNTLPLPGNSSATQDFNKEQEWIAPDDSNNGNLDFEGLVEPKPLTGAGPFGPLKGGR